jgi:hypothetical protein
MYNNWFDKVNYERNFFLLLIIFLVTFTLCRLIAGGGDSSYFIVAGSDFVVNDQTTGSIIVRPGQGYDGQFFYRMAIAPFDFSNPKYGVHIDLPPYRFQRIMYPFTVWCISMGNINIVPVALILVNVFFFMGIFYFTKKIIQLTGGNPESVLLPLIICGLYMSLSRDLSEITEVFFFTGAVYFLLKNSMPAFAFFAACSLLSRETAILAILPLTIYSFKENIKGGVKLSQIGYLIMPFIVFIAWKLLLLQNFPSNDFLPATGNLGFPFVGIFRGFVANLDISSTKNQLQLIFWICYFSWQVLLVVKVISIAIQNKPGNTHYLYRALLAIFLTWLVFAICLSDAIYSDDWSFVRVFALWNMTGVLILILKRQPTGTIFKYFSIALVTLTVLRLIVRV